jgi:serine/threonine protein kinase
MGLSDLSDLRSIGEIKNDMFRDQNGTPIVEFCLWSDHKFYFIEEAYAHNVSDSKGCPVFQRLKGKHHFSRVKDSAPDISSVSFWRVRQPSSASLADIARRAPSEFGGAIMQSQRERLKDLFEAALALNPEERAAFLDRECSGNAELRHELENLLAGDATGAFSETTTTIIGAYHLLELIGEGGMGQVWLAEQKQPVRRRVAVKLIKIGMDTREVVTRFESERQALALMDHPAIAKVFDAGSTPEGRPYFVMEYVPGIPITDYCDRHRLTVRKRMELFVQVCEGVQHAHQKAIIHRDLKPSNILVSEIDGKPMPRIIDFGVAKATSQKLTAETMYTRVGTLIGTLGYMSPEQADPVREDIDIRTDVYSLGAVLYELLTGALPLDFKKLAYNEVLRRLRDQDVPRPSTRVTTLGEESTIAAANRGSDPPTLIRQLRGDPDVIALKALEKDRARRYASPSELAADIGRYLRNELVTAHPPSIAYRTRKYFRRNKLGVATTAVVLLIVALFITWWRIPPSVPVVESVVQLTDDGLGKGGFVSDGSRIYFNEGEWGGQKIAQVSVIGGPVTPVETEFADAEVDEVARDGSGLLVRVLPRRFGLNQGPLWWVPLPAGEPHRLGSFDTVGADLLPDGHIVFAKTTLGPDLKGTDSRTQWFIADKDGSHPRELFSFPGFAGDTLEASPDGRRMLFSQQLNGDEKLFDIGVDGSGLREIRTINEGESNFIWTPDENYLVYQAQNSQQPDKRTDIWLLPMRTGLFRRPGKPIRLTNGPIPYSDPYSNPDGKQIFVLGTKHRGELVRYDIQSHEFKSFLSGISATNVTFSRDGKWITYTSYPDRILWRSRSDGTERKQLTFPPLHAYCPSISPDGTKVAFVADEFESFVINIEGGQPQKIDGPSSTCAAWSPDGNYLYHQIMPIGAGGVIVDVRTGRKSAVPSSENMVGFWLTQDTLLCYNAVKGDKFQTFDLKTRKWTDFAPGIVGDPTVWAMLSRDRKYLYFATGGADPKALRIRLSDQRVETITDLEDLRIVGISVASDGSPIFTRDTGCQEIYALNVRWP